MGEAVPPYKAEKTPERVPLSAEAVKLLESMAPKKLSGALFPGKRGTRKGKKTGSEMRVSLRRPWIEACKAAGLVKVERIGAGRCTTGLPFEFTIFDTTSLHI